MVLYKCVLCNELKILQKTLYEKGHCISCSKPKDKGFKCHNCGKSQALRTLRKYLLDNDKEISKQLKKITNEYINGNKTFEQLVDFWKYLYTKLSCNSCAKHIYGKDSVALMKKGYDSVCKGANCTLVPSFGICGGRPEYCKKCGQIVSDKTCNHSEEYIQKISGTQIRAMLSDGKRPSEIFMRPKVSDSIIKLDSGIFIK